MTRVPLLNRTDLDAPFAYADGRLISAHAWLGDVLALADRLPPRRYALNHCEDRYRFSVAFAAALLRGQTNLLPPSRAPEALRRVCHDFPDLVCIADGEGKIEGVETVIVPRACAQFYGPRAVPSLAADHVAAVAFTSGTTGRPTAHGKTWGALARGAIGEAEHLGIPAGATLIGTVPPQHMYGLESTLLLAWQNPFAFHGGRPFYADDIRAALAAVSAPRVLVTTPLHLRTLLAESSVVAALPPIDRIVSATAPLSADTAAQAEAALQAPVFEIYGCTETGMVASRRTIEGPVWRTLPGVRIHCDEARYVAVEPDVIEPMF